MRRGIAAAAAPLRLKGWRKNQPVIPSEARDLLFAGTWILLWLKRGRYPGESDKWLAAALASHFFCALLGIGLSWSDIGNDSGNARNNAQRQLFRHLWLAAKAVDRDG